MKKNFTALWILPALLCLPFYAIAQPASSCLGFSLNSQYVGPGNTTCLDVTVQDFNDVMGLQFTLQWDPALLTFSEVTNQNLPGLSDNAFGATPGLLSQGKLTLAWFNPNLEGVSRPDGTVIFSLCFEADGPAGARTEVNFSENPTPVEITLSDLSQLQNYGFYGGSVGMASDGTGPALPVFHGCFEAFDCTDNTADFQLYPDDAPGAYAWTDAGNTPVSTSNNLTDAGSGRYDLTYTAPGGESLSAWIRLGNLSGFDFTQVTITDANCATSSDGAIDLHLPDTPDYLFSWSNGATTEDLSGLAPGTYTVTVTDAVSGCSLIESFEVEAADFLVAFSNECMIFNDDSASVDVTVVVWDGGTPPYTFEWSSGDVTLGNFSSEVTLPHPTTYEVTITDANGCQYFSDPQVTLCPGFPTPGSVRLYVPSQNVQPGESFCVPVRTDNFQGIEGISFSMNWNAGVIQFDSVSTPNFPADWNYSFNLSGAGDGYLGFLAHSPGNNPFGYSLPDGSALFNLCFTAGDEPGASWLNFGSQPTVMEVSDGEDPLPLNPEDGEVLVTDGLSQLVFSTPLETTEVGQQVCLPVTATGFVGIGGLQGALRWDPEVLTFDTLYPLGLDNLNLGNTNYNQQPEFDQGRLRLLWLSQDPQGISLPAGAPLFEICFTATAPGQSPVAWTDDPIPVLAYRNDFSPAGLAILNGGVSVADNLVWPGDTDNNEVVNQYDLLNIGLAYGATGPARTDASTSWSGQPAAAWNLATPASAIDFRHMDTDGNGLIDAADTLALSLNWLQTTDLFEGETSETNLGWGPGAGQNLFNGAPLYVLPDTVQTGQQVTFPVILGEAAQPAEAVYGLAFTIVYDPELVDPNTVSAGFSNSWLGDETADLLTLYRNEPGKNRLHLALVRTNGVNRDGHGPVAQLRLTIEDVIFKSDEFELALSVENPLLISFQEDVLPVAPAQTITVVEDTSTDTDEATAADQVQVFPVPARGELFLRAPEGWVQRLELFDPEGRAVRHSGPVERLGLQGLPAGAYFLRITTERGVVSKRIIIIE